MRTGLFYLCVCLVIAGLAKAQRLCCTNNGTLTPGSSWQTVSQTSSGYFTFNATAGCIYTFSHCQNGGSGSGDPYLTIANSSCSAIIWNDDFCGLLSEITWTAPSSAMYQIHLGSYGGSGCDAITRVLAYKETCPVPMCYSVSSVSYSPDPFTSGTSVSLGDDQFSSVIPIGFNFCFDGSIYSGLLISSNGFITFNTGSAGGFSPYSVNAAIPSASDPLNAIMAGWQDNYPPGGGMITYSLNGSSPNRWLDVSWYQVPYYSCSSTLNTYQIKLYESSNCIEIHTNARTYCGVNGIQGLHNSTGTSASAVPGRNYPSAWTGASDAYLFTPTCAPCNTGIACITVLPIELESFSVTKENEKAHLKWKTTSEINTKLFAVERSGNGIDFETLITLNAAGNSNAIINYECYDEHPIAGISFYRLKQTNIDGSYSYSAIVQFEFASAGRVINVFPNPCGKSGPGVTLNMNESADVQFSITDFEGRTEIQRKERLNKGTYKIQLSEGESLQPGIYILKVEIRDQVYKTKLIVLDKD